MLDEPPAWMVFGPTRLTMTTLIPSAQPLSAAVRVIDSSADAGGKALFLNVDSMEQAAVCYGAART